MSATIANNQPQTIIHKKAGQMIDENFLELALRRCPTVSGYAIRSLIDNKPLIEADQYDRSVPIEGMLLVNTQAKGDEAIFYLGNITQKGLTALKEDVQPYTLFATDPEKPDDPGTALVSFCVEGDFPKFSDPESGHTDEYNFAHEIIIPKLAEFFEDAEQDIGKFVAKMHKPSFEKDLMAYVGYRATFIFLPLEGDPIAFGNNTLGGEFEWGSASQVHGFSTTANQEPSPITNAVSAVKKKFDAFGGKKQDPVTTDDKGIHHVGNTTIKDLKSSAAKGTRVAIKPPPKMEGTARNRWIRLFNNNELPKNHLAKNLELMVEPEMAPYAQRVVTTIAEITALEQEMRTGLKTTTPKDMTHPGSMKQAQTEIKAANAGGSYPPYTAILTDKEMMADTSVLAGFMDRDKVPSYLEIQKSEAKDPTFSESMGVPFKDTIFWSKQDTINLSHKSLNNLLAETKAKLVEKMDMKDLIATAKTETDKHIQAKEILKPETPKRKLLFGTK